MALNRQQVVDEAMRIVDAEGLDALTLRGLAGRLGVQAPTLYWHVRNKTALLDALGDRIMDDVAEPPPPGPDDDWREWLLAALVGLRQAMLAHRDGARIVSGARDSFRRADFSERAMSTLVDRGVPLQQARMTVLTAERYTIGHVLEEQASHRPGAGEPDLDLDELRHRFPTATRAITEYFSSGRTVDDVYQDGLRLILGLPWNPPDVRS
ncbi:Transcriptional regulator, TetR family [Nostocoides japonicum T1-X7]|uniref:Transcriptional regulator, TetR family n=1 Tax=Nostocoides japonicum T1-X7 TaxID=1194083 RepID=A0A077M1R6_9MICO|nr:TetR/AcrR family transcriptional regulator C-terminal domain-containing protein [Tetrasphaera japonica]CCH78149.1 Transcriptional regulator, TetR family [Tetrasphaera japonica T1-X7]